MNLKSMKQRGGLIFILSIFVFSVTLYAEIPNHNYPRTVFHHFGNASMDYYARFDMVIKSTRSTSWIDDVRALNPDIIILSTSSWSVYADRDEWWPPGTSDNYLALDSNGDPVVIPSNGYLTDITNYNPPYNDQKLNEALPEHIVSITDLTAFDGVACDWLWTQPWGVSDIDLDRNGVNDYSEYGKTWVNAEFNEGNEALLVNFRNLIPDGKLLICNSGGLHRYGTSTTNGACWEHVTNLNNFSWNWSQYQYFMEHFQEPQTPWFLCHNHASDPETPARSKDYYKLMRFLLTFTLLGDAYFSYMDSQAGEYTYNYWYDEYELQLGYPKGPAQQMSNGCLARVFDRGLSILNPTGSDKTVTVSDISGLDGYSGPYYRFYGGQDPDFNDGSLFDQVVLWGSTAWNDQLRGDGIILMTQPDTVVSDIIIDNINPGTSPGSDPATFSGNWTQSNDYSRAYYVSTKSYMGHYVHAYTNSGTGSDQVDFVPTITRPGKYEVFEWHGEVPSLAGATNVPHIITHAGGASTVVVDQTQNLGQWNSLGIYTFDIGTSGKLEINNNANGFVIADAVKFVLQHAEPDLEAPAPPTGVEVFQL